MDLPIDRMADAGAVMAMADRLSDPQVAEYFSGNRNRLAATRALLELLDIPFPNWAERGVSGRAAVTKAAIARFRADHPQEQVPRDYQPPKAR